MKKIKALLSWRAVQSVRAKLTRRVLLFGLGGVGATLLAAGGVYAAILFWPPPVPEPPPPPIALPEMKGPKEQQDFLAAIEAARKAYDVVQNDPAKVALARAARAAAICGALQALIARDWVGTIAHVGLNADKRGVLTIQIGPGVFVKTWNTTAADTGFNTLMEAKSPMYLGVDYLGKYQKVIFSGNFFNSQTDCVSEGHLTLRDAMMEPAFIFYFAEMRPILPLVREKGEGDKKEHGAKEAHNEKPAKH